MFNCDTSFFGDIAPGDSVTAKNFRFSIEHFCPTDTLIQFQLHLSDKWGRFDTLTFFEHAISQIQLYFIDRKTAPPGESLNIRGYFLNGYWQPDPGGIERVYVIFKDRNFNPVDSIELLDDGLHGDSLADDGIFGNFYKPEFEQDLIVDYHIIDNLHYYHGFHEDWFGISTTPYERIGDILLINDIDLIPPESELNSFYYRQSLNRLGFCYFYWHTYFRGIPTTDELSRYLTDGTVIWSGPTTPDLYYIPEIAYKPEIQETVGQFLNLGGSLLLAGNIIGEMSQIYPLLLNDYLHVKYVRSFNQYFYLKGLNGVTGDEIGDGLKLEIIGDYGIPQYRSEEVDLIPPADSVFLFDTTSGNGQIESSGSGAVKYDSGIYKSVFFSFDLAGITDSTVMDTVIRRSVRWLIGHLPEVVENEKHKIDIRIYPNPASGQLILHLPSDIERLTLFDISGRQIMRLKPSPKIILNLPAGIYFLQVKTEIHTRTDKIVILK